jgi:Potential Queuosine, Q, salvage protein family
MAFMFELMQPDTLGVLESTLPVVAGAAQVRIVPEAITRFARSAVAAPVPLPVEDALHCAWLPPQRFCNYLLVLESLNFSFWDDEPRWRVAYGEGRHDGYWALAAALHRALREDAVPLWDARWMAEVDERRMAEVLRGEGRTVPMLSERTRHVREAGEALLARWNGQFANLVRSADGDAVTLVKRIVAELPSFRDEAEWQGNPVRFWKRAQICVADLARLLPGTGVRAHPMGHLGALERLTAFADYKVPQVLRALGILEYGPELARQVDARDPLTAGSAAEVEIRAATLWACELAAREAMRLSPDSTAVTATEIDLRLWIAGQQSAGLKPYHRTRTAYY